MQLTEHVLSDKQVADHVCRPVTSRLGAAERWPPRMNPDQSTRSQAVNGVRFGERNGKTNQQVFRPRQTRVQRLCNRLRPTVEFVGVEVRRQ